MNIQFEPVEDSSDDDVMDTFKNTVENFQPIVEDIDTRIQGLAKKLEGYEETMLTKMVSPRSDQFKDLWTYKEFPSKVPFKTVFKTVLSMAESLDLETRTVRFSKEIADRFANGVRNHSIFALITVVIAGTDLITA